MIGFLLDTNIVSELRKQDRMNTGLQRWWADNQDSQLWLSVLVLGELRRGVELLRRRDDPATASRRPAVVARSLRTEYGIGLPDGKARAASGRVAGPPG